MGEKKLRVLGVLILLLQIGILLAYGFAGRFSFLTGFSVSSQQLFLPIYFYASLFAVGMGLVLSYFKRGSALGLATAIFTIALNVQLSPLFQKFWFSVFVDHFGRQASSGSTDAFILIQQLQRIQMSTFLQRNAIAMSVSYLIASLATIGRTGLFEIFTSLVVYNIMWPVAFFCNIRIFLNYAPNSLLLFDDFGLTYVYTFAGFFGAVYGIFLNIRSKDVNMLLASSSSFSSVLSIFGTTIVFCTLPSTIFLFPIFGNGQTQRYNVGVFNMYLAQISSVIVTVIFSLLFGKRRIGVQTILVSTLSGAAICAQVASGESNLSACLTIGAFGGLLTAFWMEIIHPRFNKGSVKDALGVIGGVLIPSFFGGVVVTPVLYTIYHDNHYARIPGFITNNEVVRFNYIYYFITVGAAVTGGIIAGILSLCTKTGNDFEVKKIFSSDFGLCDSPVDILSEVDDERQKRKNEQDGSAKNLSR